MPRVNFLIADDVALGKTVEAGLILTELLLRRRIQRVLILTPASLRLQWQEEMWDEFSLSFDLGTLPETLRLADYGLGHDDRAREHQQVACRLGARFYDWQLGQSAEESWRECHLHARNLLGEAGTLRLLAEIEAAKDGTNPTAPAFPASQASLASLAPPNRPTKIPSQKKLFE